MTRAALLAEEAVKKFLEGVFAAEGKRPPAKPTAFFGGRGGPAAADVDDRGLQGFGGFREGWHPRLLELDAAAFLPELRCRQ